MAQFSNMTLTNQGAILHTKVETGQEMHFTRVALGDGALSSEQSLQTLTALISQKQSALINTLTVEGNHVHIKAIFNNDGLSEAFVIRELGVFAQDPDVGEILYSIANAGDNTDYMPAENEVETLVEQIFNIDVIIGNTTNISATFDEAGVLDKFKDYLPLVGGILTGPLVLNADPTVNLSPATKQYVDKNSTPPNGWTPILYTCVYASATSLTISDHGDLTGMFQTGDKLLLLQGIPKYFYLVSISYNSGTDTNTFTITGGSDYTLTNVSIASAYYSKIVNPQGFPHFFNYVPTITGVSLTFSVARFQLIGNRITLFINVSGTGTTTAFTITAPIVSRNNINLPFVCMVWAVNNGIISIQSAVLATNSNMIALYENSSTVPSASSWTASGSRQACFSLIYEI
jgi:hypothetical protein